LRRCHSVSAVRATIIIASGNLLCTSIEYMNTVHCNKCAINCSKTYDLQQYKPVLSVFTARRLCIVRQDVCPSVCQLHASNVSKQLHISSKLFHCRVAPHSSFSVPNEMAIFQWEPPLTGASNTGEYEKITIFDQYLALSRKWCKIEAWKVNWKPYSSFRMVPV